MSKPKGLAEQRLTSEISAIASLALLGSLDVLNYERKAPRPLPDVRGSHVRERGLDFVECCKAAQSPHNLFSLEQPQMPTAILLPPEIWDLVAATTNSNDLANLRMTNKTMNNAATRQFGLARLTNRRFIISPFSLKGLVELTAHPVLGRCLKSVSVGTYRISAEFRGCPEGSEDTQYDAAHHAAVTQSRFEKADLHIQLLIEALTNLKAHGNRVVLGLFDDVVEDRFLRSENPPRRNGRLDGHLVRHVHRRAYGFGELYGNLDLSIGIPSAEAHAGSFRNSHALLWVQRGWGHGEVTPIAWDSGFDQVVRLLVLSDHTLMPAIDLVVKLCSDPAELHGPWHDSLMVLRSDRSMLLVNHSIMTIGMASGSTLNIYLSPYGDFTITLHSGSEKIVLRRCDVDMVIQQHWFPAQARAPRRLELLDVHIFGHDGTAEGGIVDFWTVLKDTLELEILVLGGLTFEYAA
ncbi:hypothetical protein D6C81_05594 [Aureobasidium pullulans]|nr:hypothetical protein D6C81_05594 [Aureobasidium pullulans]